MKIMITILHNNRRCRSWTNSTPEEHVGMALAVWVDAMKRIGGKWNTTPEKAAEIVNKIFDKRNIENRVKKE